MYAHVEISRIGTLLRECFSGTLSSDSNLLLGLAPGIFTGLLSTVTGLVPMLTSLDLSSLLAIFGL